jgi:arylsulfatase A-like enzyme
MGPFWFAGLLGAGLAAPAPAADPPRRPNVVLVLADDLGYATSGATGRPELYDLAADPGVAKNVAADHPAVVTRLTALAGAIAKDTRVPAR